jgi:hypothetical protein
MTALVLDLLQRITRQEERQRSTELRLTFLERLTVRNGMTSSPNRPTPTASSSSAPRLSIDWQWWIKTAYYTIKVASLVAFGLTAAVKWIWPMLPLLVRHS